MKNTMLSVSLLTLAACTNDASSTDAPAEPEAAPVPSPVSPPPPAASRTHVVFGGRTYAFVPGVPLDRQPLQPGVEICVVSGETPTCVRSDADKARWRLSVPANEKVLLLTFTRPGFLPIQLVTWSREADFDGFDTIIVPDAIAADFYAKCGATYPEAESGVLVQTRTPKWAPIGGSMMQAMSGIGPCYMAQPYVYDAQLSMSHPEGVGIGLHANVPSGAGYVDMLFTLPGKTCRSNGGGLDTAPGHLRVPLRKGFQTVLDMHCE